MPYCIRCDKIECAKDGIFAVSMNTSSNARPTNCEEDDVPYIPGSLVGSLSISSWVKADDGNIFLGTTCKGQAQASQSNIQKYDYFTNKWWIIPTKVHRAVITGTVPGASIKKNFFSGDTTDSQVSSNGIIISTKMGVCMGAEFSFKFGPIPVNMPDLKSYSGMGIEGAFINAVNIQVDFPYSPATINYTFDFPIEGGDGTTCDG